MFHISVSYVICRKLSVHDSEDSPGVTLELPQGRNPIALNERQAARLIDVVPRASPSWMPTVDMISHASHIPLQDPPKLPTPRTDRSHCNLGSFLLIPKRQRLPSSGPPGRGPTDHAAGAVDAAPDAAVDAAGDGAEGQAVVDTLDGALDGRGDALGGALDGGGEVADVALPARGPAGRLRGHALRGARHEHVERGQDEGARAGEGEELC